MKRSLNVYLEELEESEVRSLAEVIEYNNKHADIELPPSKLKTLSFESTSMVFPTNVFSAHPKQDFFIKSENLNTSPAVYDRHLAHLREVTRDRGFEKVFETHGVDVIIGPTDSDLRSLAAGGGKILIFPVLCSRLTWITRIPCMWNASRVLGL